jgi:hypothetical protein
MINEINEKSTKEQVLEAVKNHGDALAGASKELKNDREVVLEAVKQDGSALYHASEFSEDREVVLEALKQNVFAFEYISSSLKSEIVQHWITHMEKK